MYFTCFSSAGMQEAGANLQPSLGKMARYTMGKFLVHQGARCDGLAQHSQQFTHSSHPVTTQPKKDETDKR